MRHHATLTPNITTCVNRIVTSLGSSLRPLFYFLCAILFTHPVWDLYGTLADTLKGYRVLAGVHATMNPHDVIKKGEWDCYNTYCSETFS